MSADGQVTQLLARASDGDAHAWNRLVDLVYPELKRLARGSLSGKPQATLDTTSLVHECYLRLSRADGAPRDRGHLMALAVRIMRQILVDHARRRLADKRGAGAVAVSIDELPLAEEHRFEQLVEIDQALSRLADSEPRLAKVFECRYFGGLNDADAGLALELSPRTVRRDWDRSRAMLAAMLGDSR